MTYWDSSQSFPHMVAPGFLFVCFLAVVLPGISCMFVHTVWSPEQELEVLRTHHKQSALFCSEICGRHTSGHRQFG